MNKKIVITHDYNAGIVRGKEEAEKPEVSKKELIQKWDECSRKMDDELECKGQYELIKDMLEELGLKVNWEQNE